MSGSYYYPPTIGGPLCKQDVYDAELAAGYRDACAGGLIEPLTPPTGCTPQYRAEWLNEQRRHLADATERNNS